MKFQGRDVTLALCPAQDGWILAAVDGKLCWLWHDQLEST